ncbi:MAG: aminopeptidase P family N-terminal domain-containing protein, partial [Xanthobacteraceae bacterium]
MMTLAQARRARLAAAMAARGIDAMVLYGNAWQGDYLRYAADFGILEGHGVAIVSSDGTTELHLDSATEAERAEAEVLGAVVCFDPDISGAVAARLVLLRNRHVAAAPRRFLPSAL